MPNERLTNAVAALIVDREAKDEFRRSPETIGAEFELNAEELDALKSGDETRLVRLGMDHEILSPSIRPSNWWSSVVMQATRKMAAPAVVALIAMASIAGGAARADDKIPASSGRADVRARARTSIRALRADGVLGRASIRASQVSGRALARARLSVPTIDANLAGLTRARASVPGGVQEPPCFPCVEEK